MTSPEDHRMYDMTLNMFDVPAEVNRRVEEELLPMWLKQRGIDPEGK